MNEYSYFIVKYNYGIAFFAGVILIYFFTITLVRIFRDRLEFNDILDLSEKIYVKFNYNGIILEYNDVFKSFATENGENLRGVDVFKQITIDNYDTLVSTVFNNMNFNTNVDNFIISNVSFKNGSEKTIKFTGLQRNNYLGAGKTYILIGTDITIDERNAKEKEYNKNLLNTISADLRFAEEELERNFKQIQEIQETVNSLRNRQKTFIDNLPIGVIEYDFKTRQLVISSRIIKFFIPNAKIASIDTDEVLVVLYNFIPKDSLLDIVEAIYNAITNKTVNFSYKIHLNHLDGYVLSNATIIYKNNEPDYIYLITDFSNIVMK